MGGRGKGGKGLGTTLTRIITDVKDIATAKDMKTFLSQADAAFTPEEVLTIVTHKVNFFDKKFTLATAFLTANVKGVSKNDQCDSVGQRFLPGDMEIWKVACRHGKFELMFEHLTSIAAASDKEIEDSAELLMAIYHNFDFLTKDGELIVPEYILKAAGKEEKDEKDDEEDEDDDEDDFRINEISGLDEFVTELGRINGLNAAKKEKELEHTPKKQMIVPKECPPKPSKKAKIVIDEEDGEDDVETQDYCPSSPAYSGPKEWCSNTTIIRIRIRIIIRMEW